MCSCPTAAAARASRANRRPAGAAVRQRGREHLDRHRPVERRVERLEHHAHPAPAQDLQHLVGTEPAQRLRPVGIGRVEEPSQLSPARRLRLRGRDRRPLGKPARSSVWRRAPARRGASRASPQNRLAAAICSSSCAASLRTIPGDRPARPARLPTAGPRGRGAGVGGRTGPDVTAMIVSLPT